MFQLFPHTCILYHYQCITGSVYVPSYYCIPTWSSYSCCAFGLNKLKLSHGQSLKVEECRTFGDFVQYFAALALIDLADCIIIAIQLSDEVHRASANTSNSNTDN